MPTPQSKEISSPQGLPSANAYPTPDSSRQPPAWQPAPANAPRDPQRGTVRNPRPYETSPSGTTGSARFDTGSSAAFALSLPSFDPQSSTSRRRLSYSGVGGHPRSQNPWRPRHSPAGSTSGAQTGFRPQASIGTPAGDIGRASAPNIYPHVIDPRYKRRPRDFFIPGRVMKVYWHEPAGDEVNEDDIDIDDDRTSGTSERSPSLNSTSRRSVSMHGYLSRDTEFAYHKSCVCVPMVTYGGQGVGKRGVKKNDHAAAYMSGSNAHILPTERPRRRGEKPMRDPIRIQPDDIQVEYNVGVMPYGLVHKQSERAFHYTFRNVFWPDADGPLPEYDKNKNNINNGNDNDNGDDDDDDDDDNDDEDESEDDDSKITQRGKQPQQSDQASARRGTLPTVPIPGNRSAVPTGQRQPSGPRSYQVMQSTNQRPLQPQLPLIAQQQSAQQSLPSPQQNYPEQHQPSQQPQGFQDPRLQQQPNARQQHVSQWQTGQQRGESSQPRRPGASSTSHRGRQLTRNPRRGADQ